MRVEVTQGIARQIVLSLPDGLVVNQVQGATVGEWNQAQTSLTVPSSNRGVRRLALVSAETRIPREGPVTIPIVRLPAADRETGGLAVDVVGPGEMADRQPRGLDPADASDLGDIVSGRESPSMAAFRFKPLAGTAPRALTLTVTRFTPQAVLVANVEEARYDALVAEDGKTLVHARYAVRNNQRSFLAVTLPPESTLWSATLAGRPIRPGLWRERRLLLPLQKGRTGEEAPTFVVELVYLQRAERVDRQGNAHIDLPAVDLPVSRTGLLLHHSPRFQVEPRPGSFRVESDTGPWSAALRTDLSSGGLIAAMPSRPQTAAAGASKDPASSPFRSETAGRPRIFPRCKFPHQEAGRTTAGVIPVQVVFPQLGPAVFLAAELTAENTRIPVPAEMDYKRMGRPVMDMKIAVFFVGFVHCAAAQDFRGPQGPGGTVTISRPDYDRMLDLAARRAAPGEVPPVAAALTRTEIRARVGGRHRPRDDAGRRRGLPHRQRQSAAHHGRDTDRGADGRRPSAAHRRRRRHTSRSSRVRPRSPRPSNGGRRSRRRPAAARS